jgi:hypothetical protein
MVAASAYSTPRPAHSHPRPSLRFPRPPLPLCSLLLLPSLHASVVISSASLRCRPLCHLSITAASPSAVGPSAIYLSPLSAPLPSIYHRCRPLCIYLSPLPASCCHRSFPPLIISHTNVLFHIFWFKYICILFWILLSLQSLLLGVF